MTQLLLSVALGGALGSVARFLTVSAFARVFSPAFPLGTLFVNVLGSFLIGLVATWLMRKVPDHDVARFFLTTGFLGGFTTFSAFSLEVLTLVQRGDAGWAAFYIVSSLALSLAAVFVGYAMAQGIAG